MSVWKSFVIASALLAAGAVRAAVGPGDAAPDFTLQDVAGKPRSLAEFKGKTVVLEWNNPNCPFVQKHYKSGNMQQLQAAAAARGVAWLTINSTRASHGDFMPAAALAQWMQAQKAQPAAYLLDADGQVGRLYGAKTTPHLWVIGPDGRVLYAGGIDDRRSTNVDDVPGAKNFVKAALDESLAGKAVSVPAAPPYGCGVKY
jgi:peroxiredoxin